MKTIKETIKDKVYYKFECDSTKARENNIKHDDYFDMDKHQELDILIEKCYKLNIEFNVYLEVFCLYGNDDIQIKNLLKWK